MADEFVEKWAQAIDYFKYYQNGAQKKIQEGIIRTNCLQSIERTNLIQAKVALKVLKDQLSHHKINVETSLGTETILAKFCELWNNNGVELGNQYTNTEENKGMFESIASGFMSLISNPGNYEKQYLELLLGNSKSI